MISSMIESVISSMVVPALDSVQLSFRDVRFVYEDRTHSAQPFSLVASLGAPPALRTHHYPLSASVLGMTFWHSSAGALTTGPDARDGHLVPGAAAPNQQRVDVSRLACHHSVGRVSSPDAPSDPPAPWPRSAWSNGGLRWVPTLGRRLDSVPPPTLSP